MFWSAKKKKNDVNTTSHHVIVTVKLKLDFKNIEHIIQWIRLVAKKPLSFEPPKPSSGINA